MSSASSLPSIAIVGIASQFPSGELSSSNFDDKEFFDFLMKGDQAYERMPAERFNIDSYKGDGLGQVRSQLGTFLKHTDQLDNVELGITNKDAKAMSLSTRKLIELSFLALLDSGIDYRSRNVGCFASGIAHDIFSISEADIYEARGSFGGPPAMIANRISYHLDLLGPSVPVDTACSSSLTATHLAVQSIRNGDCEAAIVAGIQLNHRLVDWIQYSQGGILSPDGMCKPFDESANGFSRGEAGVAIVLKSLDKAIEDRDHIYATILGTGINSTGAAAPVNAPVATAQRDAMLRAWSQTGRRPQDVDFIEVHATGTAAGDPTEANWVGETFYRGDELLMGSVKGNIGHTEITAFLASLTKCMHILRTGLVPPNVNLLNRNPKIKWGDYMLNVPSKPVPLGCRSESKKSLIALCGSGIGGSNGHVVLEGPPQFIRSCEPSSNPPPYVLLMAGGLSPRSTTSVFQDLQDLIVEYPDDLQFLSMTYGRRCRQLTWRSFAIQSSAKPVEPVSRFTPPSLAPREKPPIIFIFGGQGPQHFEMGRELFKFYPVFRRSVLEMDQMYQRITGSSLISTTGLFSHESDSQCQNKLGDIWPIAITLPAIAILQCAMVDLLAHIGIVPDGLVGHSAGETAVLYASGAASKAMVIEMAISRGKVMSIMETMGGSMAALSCGVDEAQKLLSELRDEAPDVDVGCHNSPDAVTLSGLSTSIDKIVDVAGKRGILARRLKTRIPVHSQMMEHCREEFARLIGLVWETKENQSSNPQIPVYSTTTGDVFEDAFDLHYFWSGTRGPVLFTEAMTALLRKYPSAVALEISPHPVLSSYASSLGCSTTISCLKRPKRNEGAVEVYQFLTAIGQLTVAGVNTIDFSALNFGPRHNPDIRLPSYPFNPKTIPYHAESPSYYRQFEPRNGPLNFQGLRINAQTHPVLAEHVIKGEPIMPAAGFIEMALEFGANTLWDVKFSSMLSLSHESPIPIEISRDGPHWSVRSSTASGYKKHDLDKFDRVHAEGFLSTDIFGEKGVRINLQNIKKRCSRIDLTDFYHELKYFADYGPAFQRVIDAYEGDSEFLMLIRGDDNTLPMDGYVFHPAILDCCLHLMVHRSFTLTYDPNVYYLPSKVKRLTLSPDFIEHGAPDVLYAHLVFKEWTPSGIIGDFLITAINGTVLCSLVGVEIERHESAPTKVEQRYDLVLQPYTLQSRPSTDKDQILRPNFPIHETQSLYRYLDDLAFKISKATLGEITETGSSLDRQRYADCLQSMVNRYNSEKTISDEEARVLRSTWPELMEVTDRVASVQDKIIQSSKAAVGELFKDDILTRFYERYVWASEACALRVSSLIDLLARQGKHVIRVLEVGSGTGALSRQLSKIFASFPSLTIEYFVTDVSKELLPKVSHTHTRYSSLDISKDPIAQGFTSSSFDIITAFHVIHAVPDLNSTLKFINSLLVPSGALIMGDLRGDSWSAHAEGSFWFDYVFGSFSEWFSFNDGRTHCTMSINSWQTCLDHAGFSNVSSEIYENDPLLFTLEAQKCTSAEISHTSERVVLYHYQRGKEEDLRKLLLGLDGYESTLWLYTKSGLDGDSGVGLCRSLNKEYPLCKVLIAIFDDQSWTKERMSTFVSTMSGGEDSVFYVDCEGQIMVPRLVSCPAPTKRQRFDPYGNWKLNKGGFRVASLQTVEPDAVGVRTMAVSSLTGLLRAFVGRCDHVGAQSFYSERDLVIGITSSPDISNILTINDACVTKLEDNLESTSADIVGALLPLFIAHVGYGKRRKVDPGHKVLLIRDGGPQDLAICWYLHNLGYYVVEWDPKLSSLADLHELAVNSFSILSGTTDSDIVKMLKMRRRPATRLFLWNDPEEGLDAMIARDPLIVSGSLREIISEMQGKWDQVPYGEVIDIGKLALPPQGELVPSDTTLFDSTKAYVLIGGIGGVGIRVALWMYQKGARYLVLTSRSGAESLQRVQDRLALRIINYLRTLHDLKFELVASDATSRADTTELLESITAPIGGCMLLSVVLSDRTFALQTPEDFDKPFIPKVGACATIHECLKGGISSLDFFVGFSSIVGLLGNGGQTNYCSANTALDGMMRKWDNSFTFILPAVTDGGGLASETRETDGRLGHLTPWGLSSQQICDCLEDGLYKLAEGPFWQYVPDLNWGLVQKHTGASSVFAHLVNAEDQDNKASTGGEKTVKDIIIDLLDVEASEFDPDVPFTSYGLDSLSASRLSFALKQHVVISQLQLLSDISYNDLQARIDSSNEENRDDIILNRPLSSPTAETNTLQISNPLEEMELSIKKYSRIFPSHTGRLPVPNADVVLVTGTTGGIGSAVLANLARLNSVSRIYALNRPSSTSLRSLYQRQASSLREKGYEEKILESGKIIMIEGDQSKYDLGLAKDLYEEIKNSVTVIIHNAWPVNFTASFASLDPAIRSVKALIDLALASPLSKPPRLMFISSIGLLNGRRVSGAGLEAPITDGRQVLGTGYTESKWVGEQLLQIASERTSLRPTIVRVGQICGGTNGSWNTKEWFPALLKSSVYMRYLPETEGTISWLPLDTAGRALVELMHSEKLILHLSHPNPITWHTAAKFISKTLRLNLVPYQDWLSRLESSAGLNETDGRANPALRLLQYFVNLQIGTNPGKEALGMPMLDVSEAIKGSPTLRNAQSLTSMDVASWIRDWERIGFLKEVQNVML